MSLGKIVHQILRSAKCQQKSFHTTAKILATDVVRWYYFLWNFCQNILFKAEDPLFVTVNSPFIYTEFDVNYHRQVTSPIGSQYICQNTILPLNVDNIAIAIASKI